jgi:hypothetical protein
MPDISMCQGEDCPVKKKCYRHTATPNQWQSYFAGAPLDPVTGSCQYFWDNKDYSKMGTANVVPSAKKPKAPKKPKVRNVKK